MKSKDIVFFGISILSLTLFMLLPVAHSFAAGTELPGMTFCQYLLDSVNHLVSYQL